MRTKIQKKLKSLFSPFFIVSAVILVFGLTVKIIAGKNAAFADFWQSSVAVYPRAALAYMTNLLPFSLAEYVILCSPLIIAVVIRVALKEKTETWTASFRYTFNLLAAAALMYSVFLMNFSTGYYTTPLDRRIGIERTSVSADDLYVTADKLIDGIDGCSDSVEFAVGGSSVMPYDMKELYSKLNEAYKKTSEKYPFISKFHSTPKSVALSVPLTYTHIAGIYTFFTGEANINVNFPDYTLPYTAAHEMAHQRGIAREDEANFVAFLVCMESDDDYIKYSAYVSSFEYVASSLYETNSDLYRKLYVERAPLKLKNEMTAYNNFFEKYKENTAASVAGGLNDSHLKSYNQPAGERSYGLVVDLLVAYYKK